MLNRRSAGRGSGAPRVSNSLVVTAMLRPPAWRCSSLLIILSINDLGPIQRCSCHEACGRQRSLLWTPNARRLLRGEHRGEPFKSTSGHKTDRLARGAQPHVASPTVPSRQTAATKCNPRCAIRLLSAAGLCSGCSSVGLVVELGAYRANDRSRALSRSRSVRLCASVMPDTRRSCRHPKSMRRAAPA